MPEANLFIEKRSHPRIPVKLHVKYRLVEDLAGIQNILNMRQSEMATQTLDVSMGGMYIVSDQNLETGQILHLEINLEKNVKSFTAFAEVVWRKESGAGLHFMVIKEADIAALETFLASSSSTQQ